MGLLQRIEKGQENGLKRATLPARGDFSDLKTRVQNRLLAELDPAMDISNTEEVREILWELFEKILDEDGIIL